MAYMSNMQRTIVFVIGITMFCSVMAWSAATQAAATFGADGEAITMEARFVYPANAGAAPLERIWLAGFTDTESGVPSTLGVALTHDTSGWIPVWQIQLHSDEGLLANASHGTAPKTDAATGTQYINLATFMPQPGTTYDTLLSYDRATGAVAIWVNNADTDTPLYNQSINISPYDGRLHPTAGVVPSQPGVSVQDRFVPSTDWQVREGFIPKAADWGLVDVIDGVPDTIFMHAVQRNGSNDVGIRIRRSGARTGRFDFYSETNGQRVPIVSVPATDADEAHIIPFDMLPYGFSDFIMEYVDGGEVLVSKQRQIRVGRIEASVIAPVYEPGTGIIQGALELWADGALPHVAVTLEAELFHLQWDAAGSTYRSVSHGTVETLNTTLTLDKQKVAVPVQLLTEGEPGLWHIQYRVSVEPDVLFGTNVHNQLLGTYDGARPDATPVAVPLIIAHRGASSIAPENTVAAFEEAMHIGVDLVEMDLHRTRDGHLAVIHDGTVDRTTTGAYKGAVSALTLAQIQSLDAGSWKSPAYAGARIPTFEQTLLTVKDKTLLLIEGKVTGIEGQVAEEIRGLNMTDGVVYQSFDPASVAAFRRLMPEVPAGVLYGNPGIADDFRRAATVLTQALAVDASIVAINYGAVTPAFVRLVHQGGLDVWTWTVNGEADMKRMLDAGVDGIITDYPQRLRALLQLDN